MVLRLLGCAVLATVVAACGGGGGDEQPASPGRGAALADVIAVDAAVDVSLDAAAFESVHDPVPVAVGDVVRTDDSGFAEIAYFDGSFTRLDVRSELTIVELARRGAVSSVRAEMGVGRTWSRVEELADAEDEFVVETPVATAAVRGTVFFIDCQSASSCRFTVVEGELEVRTAAGDTQLLRAPAAVDVDAAGIGETAPVEPATLLAEDPWLARNVARDAIADPGGDAEAADSGDAGEDIDLAGVEPCSLLDEEAVRGLTDESVDFATQEGSDRCFWGATRPGIGAYVEVRVSRARALPSGSSRSGCAVTPTDDVGEDAEIVSCPAGAVSSQSKVELRAYTRGVGVTILVNDADVPAEELVAAAETVLSRLG